MKKLLSGKSFYKKPKPDKSEPKKKKRIGEPVMRRNGDFFTGSPYLRIDSFKKQTFV